MDINNNTQVSSININPVSKINLNSANKAFKASMDSKENNVEDFKKDDIALLEEQNIQNTMEKQGNKIDVAEIQKYASDLGENLSIDDINYGLMYGRSVIADYSA